VGVHRWSLRCVPRWLFRVLTSECAQNAIDALFADDRRDLTGRFANGLQVRTSGWIAAASEDFMSLCRSYF
jgi:hypothetical protein